MTPASESYSRPVFFGVVRRGVRGLSTGRMLRFSRVGVLAVLALSRTWLNFQVSGLRVDPLIL